MNLCHKRTDRLTGDRSSTHGATPSPEPPRLAGFGLLFSEPNTRPSAILVDEFDAGCFERPLYRLNSPRLQCVSPLKPSNRVNRDLCGRGEFPNTQTEGCSRHSTLNGQKNHDKVLISVDRHDF